MTAYRAIFILAITLLICQNSIAQNFIKIDNFTIQPVGGRYAVSADIRMTFPEEAKKTLKSSVTLQFSLYFKISTYRWYWFDQNIVEATRQYELTWNALSKQYRLKVEGVLVREYPTLEGALETLTRVRLWPVIDRDNLQHNDVYDVTMRFWLNPGRLPKPLQINIFDTSVWQLDSGEYHWSYLHVRTK